MNSVAKTLLQGCVREVIRVHLWRTFFIGEVHVHFSVYIMSACKGINSFSVAGNWRVRRIAVWRRAKSVQQQKATMWKPDFKSFPLPGDGELALSLSNSEELQRKQKKWLDSAAWDQKLILMGLAKLRSGCLWTTWLPLEWDTEVARSGWCQMARGGTK